MPRKKLNLETATIKLEQELKIIEEGKIPFEELVEHYETAAKTLAFCFETLEVCNAKIIAADKLIKKYRIDNEEIFDE